MKHFYKCEDMHNAMPVIAQSWADEVTKTPDEIIAGIRYKKTRSTIAVEAFDIFELEDEYAVAAFKSLIRFCKTAGRDEIVIERLEDLVADEDRSICDCLDTFQRAIVRTYRSMNQYPARVSLEKRGLHHDLRIYLTFHEPLGIM